MIQIEQTAMLAARNEKVPQMYGHIRYSFRAPRLDARTAGEQPLDDSIHTIYCRGDVDWETPCGVADGSVRAGS